MYNPSMVAILLAWTVSVRSIEAIINVQCINVSNSTCLDCCSEQASFMYLIAILLLLVIHFFPIYFFYSDSST